MAATARRDAADLREEAPADSGVRIAAPRFADVYDAHFDEVWSAVRRLGVSDSVVDEVVQDVFLRVHEELLASAAPHSAWLSAIVSDVVGDHARRSSLPLGVETAEPRVGDDRARIRRKLMLQLGTEVVLPSWPSTAPGGAQEGSGPRPASSLLARVVVVIGFAAGIGGGTLLALIDHPAPLPPAARSAATLVLEAWMRAAAPAPSTPAPK